MSLGAWIIFGAAMALILFLNTLLKDKKTKQKNKKNESDDIVAPKFKTEDPWQKRNLFNGTLYFVGLPAIWLILATILFFLVVNGF